MGSSFTELPSSRSSKVSRFRGCAVLTKWRSYVACKREELADFDPDILLADGFDDALIGYTTSWGPEKSRSPRAVYNYEHCVDILMRTENVTYEEAVEHLEFNTLGAYLGKYTPVFVHTE
jgi:hypothetical protein